ncbi:hypothetical protein QAD02_010428 [Eretmocerus hayati]|uniref:Uncharacterized protein n=1 Tax=Eretmocerus hayati TaxID=131215 RepID=A0ACC2NU73_9HYME|nr:hypothetical protein QAD02_010428 [Eretmocerus hayati]
MGVDGKNSESMPQMKSWRACESTFRVTLQKSSRGLGLSVSGGGTSGPVRVKRLFPQQPAALSNRLQPGDILLAANGIPLTGLTNYEALEVLRTTSNTVELVVSRLPGEKDKQPSTPPGQGPPPPPQRRNTHDRTAPLSTDATTSSINTTTTTSTTGSSSNRPQLTLKIPPLKPLAPLDLEPCGEFDIEMTKVSGSLGFTLRKADSSALGHYVRALVREPALSDGRIQPGDKIIAVDDQPLSPMSHEEAVALLRRCGPRVKLRLYRDLAQTPVSALSPTEPTDHPLRPPKTCLRQEAVDMLCDLAVRKLSPGTSSGSSGARQSSSNDDGGGGSGSGSGACTSTAAGGATSNSPRRLRRPAARSSNADADEGSGGSGRTRTSTNRGSRASTLSQEEATSTVIVASSDSDACSIKTQLTAPEAPTSILPSASIGSNSTSHRATQLPSRKPSTIANESHQPQICADYSSDSSSQFHQEPVLRSNGYPPRRSSSLRNGYSEGPLFDSDCSECAAAAALGPDVIIVTDSCSETEEHTQPPQPQARRRHPGVYPPEEQLSSDDCDLDGRHGGGGPSSMPPRMKLLHAYDRDERDESCCCRDRDRNGVTSNGFSYRNPAYQSANPACGVGGAGSELQPPATGVTGHSSDRDIPGKVMGADDPVGSKGLLKWKGVMFAPSDPDETDGRCVIKEDRSASGSGTLSGLHEQGHEVFMVELTRGWNSRLGFSLQPEGDNTVISVVHPDSVAAKDGRLKQGDILIMVNDESVEHMTTADIIDLLRKIRGSIGITVLRRKKDST